jgi:hypothetical protein
MPPRDRRFVPGAWAAWPVTALCRVRPFGRLAAAAGIAAGAASILFLPQVFP